MTATGYIRRIDDLGRICIPKEIRRQIFGTNNAEGKQMDFFIDGDSIVLKKFEDYAAEQPEQEVIVIDSITTKKPKVLILKSESFLKEEDLNRVRNAIYDQIRSGICVIPSGFTCEIFDRDLFE